MDRLTELWAAVFFLRRRSPAHPFGWFAVSLRLFSATTKIVGQQASASNLTKTSCCGVARCATMLVFAAGFRCNGYSPMSSLTSVSAVRRNWRQWWSSNTADRRIAPPSVLVASMPQLVPGPQMKHVCIPRVHPVFQERRVTEVRQQP